MHGLLIVQMANVKRSSAKVIGTQRIPHPPSSLLVQPNLTLCRHMTKLLVSATGRSRNHNHISTTTESTEMLGKATYLKMLGSKTT